MARRTVSSDEARQVARTPHRARYRDLRVVVPIVAIVLLICSCNVFTSSSNEGGGDEKKDNKRSSKSSNETAGTRPLSSIPFDAGKKKKKKKKSKDEEINASGIVSLSDGRFLICDNRTDDALFELTFAGEDIESADLSRLELTNLPGKIEDLEALTAVVDGGETIVFGVTSLSSDEKATGVQPRRNGLLRIRRAGLGPAMSVEMIGDFQGWLKTHVRDMDLGTDKLPDSNGLNVEGLAWDPKRRALLFGLRTPLKDGRPMILPVRVRDLHGPWDASNLEMLTPISLDTGASVEKSGVRGMEFDPDEGRFLILLGRAVSGDEVPFRLFHWDGGDAGKLVPFQELRFDEKMKPEGVAPGSLGGRRGLIFVDDGGGFAFLERSDPRLRSN